MTVQFPVQLPDGITVAYSVTGSIVKVYLEYNPLYDTTIASSIKTELYKLGKKENVFNVLVTIQYPESDKEFHELLIFNRVELTDESFVFELIGD